MTLPPHDTTLRQKAREAIRAGKLPTHDPDRTMGGAGSGAPCAVCGEPVTRRMTELEIVFNHKGAAPGRDTYRLHHRCFGAWEIERRQTEERGPAIGL